MTKSNTNPTSGILLLDKPSGVTSNQALGRAKRLLGIRKAGHTGTLDPMATGLLTLCFGEATKVSAFLLDADKTYLAELRLGVETDSGDADGAVVRERPVPGLDGDDVEAVLREFRGSIEQVPPMVSALKHQGQRLHELARRGIEVERPPRPVTIHELELLDCVPPRLELRVRCSKGTYVRSLAMDIGDRLGCGAHLTALRRTVSDPFDVDDAIDPDALEALEPEARRARLLSPEQALVALPLVEVDAEAASDLGFGRRVRTGADPAETVRIRHGDRFLGVGRVDDTGVLHPKRLIRA